MAGGDRKWEDGAFLDLLRRQGDALADETVRRLREEHGTETVSRLFQSLRVSGPIPEDSPLPLRDFLDATSELPPGLDVARARRGGEVFLHHAFEVCVVLLASSLPQGYAAPTLTRILTISDDLGHHPYRRLLGVLQLLVDLADPRAFDGAWVARITAQKLRLLHAGVRSVVPRYRPEFEQRYGLPVSHEDMLATLMGFSLLVIDGLRRLDLGLSAEEEGDFYYMWRQFALLMGIHPPGEPESFERIPSDLEEAETFFDAYRRRWFKDAQQNADGVDLAQVNLRMMEDLLPRWVRWLGGRAMPRIAMFDLLGSAGMARVGLEPLAGDRFLRAVFLRILGGIQSAEDDLPAAFAARFARLLFRRMIRRGRGGPVEFSIPVTADELRRLA